MKVLITGGSGFIATNLINYFSSKNCEIAVINRRSMSCKNLLKQYNGDITNYKFVSDSVEDFQPSHVFHLAAFKERSSNVEDISNSISTNLLGTLNLYQSLLNIENLISVITLGTTDEYGECSSPYHEKSKEMPTTSYGFSKFCATKLSELFFRNFNLPVTILRPTIAYGPHQGLDMFIPSLIHSLMRNKEYKMTLGEQNRDFIYISDLIDVMILLINKPEYYGQVFNIGSGQSIKIKQVASIVANLLNKQSFLKIGGIQYRKKEMMDYKISTSKLNKNLLWVPKVDLQKGIKLTIKHYQNSV